MPVHWRRRALLDLARIVDHIASENPVAAVRIARELLLAGDSLVTFPYRGRPGRQPRTRELLATYPYLIVYRVTANQAVTVLRVWHGAQERR